MYVRNYAEVSLSAIEYNILNIRKKLPQNTELMAILKADAYGHGANVIAEHYEKYIDRIGVASLEEGIELRRSGIKMPILILGYTSPNQYELLIDNMITPTVYDLNSAQRLSDTAVALKKTVSIDIAVDTGMTRIGFRVNKESADIIKEISLMPNIKIDGIFTHLSCADTYDEEHNKNQFNEFDLMIGLLKEINVNIPTRHICNSAGIMKYPEKYYECVRAGIILYGMYPSDEVDKKLIDLKPALEWKAHVINISNVEPGRGVSYGAVYVTEKPITQIATVSAGYADGYPRALSSKGEVLIHGKRAKILGRVCMDQMMVDVSDIEDVKIEDVVTLIGHDGNEYISMEEIGTLSGSFNYEVSCGIGKRVKRIYK